MEKILETLKVEINKPISVFVAATEAEWLPMRVLEFSIRENCSSPVEVNALYTYKRDIPLPKKLKNRPRTPFSFQRFLIPEICGYEGRAIYLDSDMLVFGDISEIWNQPFNGNNLQTVREVNNRRFPQFSVMLLDCASLRWSIDKIVNDLDYNKLNYSDLMYHMKVARSIGKDIPSDWNSLECYSEGQTKLLHYTDMDTQPWVSTANPHSDLWVSCLRRALVCNFIGNEEIKREIETGHVRPSLLAQIETNQDSSLALSPSIYKLDTNFNAPYKNLDTAKSSPWTSIRSAAVDLLRRNYYRSPISRFFTRLK